MRLTSFTRGTLGLLALGSFAWGCSSRSSDCHANKNCGPYEGGAAGTSGSSGSSGRGGGSSGSSGTSGGSGVDNDGGGIGDEGGASGVGGSSGTSGTAGSGGAPCDGTSAPDSAQCVIGDEYGLFVSLAGNDTTGDGSEAKPLATVTKALSLTRPRKINRVYVCSTANGSTTSYAEPDTLVIPDRVSIYGGFTCANSVWAYDATVKAWLKPASPVGAIISNALNGVTVQDLRIDAINAPEDGTGASSFGMVVKGSKGVTLTHVEIHAGKGGGGAAGLDGANGADGMTSGFPQNGAPAICSSPPNSQDGGKSVAAICTSQGGNGGTAGVGTVKQSVQDGQSGFPTYVGNFGAGQAAGQDGLPGQPGPAGTAGSLGSAAQPVGVFSNTGYARASGGDGSGGKPGQGGGGGGASLGSTACVGASGGAGGMGGCGGDPGTGGTGGGASVALLSWASALTLDDSTLIANVGGAGGAGGVAHGGGNGKAGGTGGAANIPNTIGGGGDGGKGGNGGNGGSGAGGTGGPSLALVWSVTKPTLLNNPTLTGGAGGAHGVGGHLGLSSANWAPDGSDGMSAAEYEQK